MASITVQFRYLTGLKRKIFRDARLIGSWDESGRWSQSWTETPMTEIVAEDGCPGFSLSVKFDAGEVGKLFQWTVRLSTPAAADVSGIPTEVNDANQSGRVRTFQLAPAVTPAQTEAYYFTQACRLGARKVFVHGRSGGSGLRFAVWAPNAQLVEVVFGDPATGYIADDGYGIDASRTPLPMAKDAAGSGRPR